ncbi:MAG: hypothetical protein JWN40_5165 [Phycisphaerales bacterium]|nr:hypothetical protein [Phycisphaerales bacterium]
MRWKLATALLGFCALTLTPLFAQDKPQPDADGFYPLFDGKTLDGWKVGKNPETFKVEDGVVVVNGKGPAHLFYEGPVNNHDFKNFHLKAVVKTFPKANSGIYFHTTYQEANWPDKGFESQVNATHTDRKKTGGLYNVKDVMDNAPNKDGEWFLYEVIVEGKKVTLKVDGKVTTEWEQPDGWKGPEKMPGRVLDHGTIALQGHDPGSKVLYKSVAIKPLP